MIENQLCAILDRRAGAFLAAAQFGAEAGKLRTAAIVGASAAVARTHGIAGVEGYLAALHLGPSEDGIAGRAIREAIDEAIVAIAAAAWAGQLSSRGQIQPRLDRAAATANVA